jgi:hypothetical protein
MSFLLHNLIVFQDICNSTRHNRNPISPPFSAERMVHLRARTIRTCLKTYIIQRPSGATTGSPVLSAFQMCFQISVVILVRSNHYQFETVAAETVREEIQLVQQIKLMDIDASQVAFLFSSERRILYDLIYFAIKF